MKKCLSQRLFLFYLRCETSARLRKNDTNAAKSIYIIPHFLTQLAQYAEQGL